jgi:hypothetical protein
MLRAPGRRLFCPTKIASFPTPTASMGKQMLAAKPLAILWWRHSHLARKTPSRGLDCLWPIPTCLRFV